MKKIITFSISLLLILCLVACGTSLTEKIDKQLQGTWTYQTSGLVTEITFENGRYIPTLEYEGNKIDGVEGVYEIDTENNKILITFENGNETEYSYTYKNGELKIKNDSYYLTKIK